MKRQKIKKMEKEFTSLPEEYPHSCYLTPLKYVRLFVTPHKYLDTRPVVQSLFLNLNLTKYICVKSRTAKKLFPHSYFHPHRENCTSKIKHFLICSLFQHNHAGSNKKQSLRKQANFHFKQKNQGSLVHESAYVQNEIKTVRRAFKCSMTSSLRHHEGKSRDLRNENMEVRG